MKLEVPIFTYSENMIKAKIKQETTLPQKDRATRYVTWYLVNCCTDVRKITFERLAWGNNIGDHSSLKVIEIASVR